MVNGNRNRIALTNDIYNVETKESIKGIQISNESSNYDYKKITVYSGPFEYLYVYTTDNYSKYNLTDAKVYKNLELMEKTQQNGGLYINYTEDQILNKYDYRYYVSGSTIAQATGDTARCGFFELKPNSFYCIPMHKGDRYRVALTNELYTNKTVNNLYWYEGSIVYFYNKDCKYCYVYISNNKKEFDVPIYIGKLSTTYTNIYGGKANSNLNLFDTNIISTTLDYIINVQDYGAKGDGSTDDTEALEEAMKAGYEQNKPVVFPNGEYLIRRPLTLRNNMEIYGLNNAIIKKQKATTTRLSTQLNEGSEVMTVQSVVGFKVGDAITVSKQADTYPAARYCSVGIITAINTSTNQITFKSAYDTIKKGAIQNHPIGCYVTNSCAIFRS